MSIKVTPPDNKPDGEPISDPFQTSETKTLPPADRAIQGRYRVIRRLGRGGMGEVFLCRDVVLDRVVAVKFPMHALSPRFLDEARHASRLNHENIARLYHFDHDADGHPFIVMEYVEGERLKDLLKDRRLPPKQAVQITDSVLSALEEAHRLGIIHRDIKPANVMITSEGNVKVLDFGLAKRFRQTMERGVPEHRAVAETAEQTQEGHVVGTPRYMAPEQLLGEELLDERCDLFAVGALLFECLTGRPAFRTEQDRKAAVPPPSSLAPGISSKLDQVVATAMAESRENRYRDARSMRAALPHRKSWQALGQWFLESARKPRRAAALAAAAALIFLLPTLYDKTRTVFDRHPAEAVRLYEDGLAALRDGTYYRASRALERAVAVDPDFSIARARLAESLFELEYTDRAQSELLKVLGKAKPTGKDGLLVEALRLTFSRNFAAAGSIYQQIADQSSGADKAQALMDLGRTLERNNQPQQALARFQAAVALNPGYPAAFLKSGILLDRLSRDAESKAAFRRAEELYQALSNLEGQAEVWYQRGRLAAEHRRVRDALEALDRSLILAKSAGSAYQEIEAMLQVSGVQHLQGQTAEAEKTARAGIERAQQAGIPNLAALGLLSLGNAFLVAGRYDRAEPEFDELLNYSRQHELQRPAATALFSLASVHSQLGKSDQVIREIDEASRFFRQGGFTREVSQCVLLRTRALRQLGRYQEAVDGAKAQMQTNGDQAQVALLKDAIASTLTILERYPEALDYYQETEKLNRSLGYQAAVGFALAGRARVAGRLGDFESAQQYLREAASIAGNPESGLRSLLAVVGNVEAEIALARASNKKAASEARRAIALSTGGQVRIESQLILVDALARSDDRRSALSLARDSVSRADDYGDPYLKSRAQLALAGAALAAGDFGAAAMAANQATEKFTQAAQLESAWRAQALRAEVLRRLGKSSDAEDAGMQASALLERLRTAWPSDMVSRYLARPDLAFNPYQQYIKRRIAHVPPCTPSEFVGSLANGFSCSPSLLLPAG